MHDEKLYHIILLYFIAKLSIRKPGSSSVLIISQTLFALMKIRAESFAIIKIRGVSTKYINYMFLFCLSKSDLLDFYHRCG